MQPIRNSPAHITRIASVCLTAFVLAVTPVTLLAQHEPQTRADAITFMRQRKATALSPNRPSHGEETFTRISGNDLIGRILGSSIGLGLRLGGLPTGSGFALGPRYYRPDLAGENIVFKSWAVGSIGRFYEVAASLGMPHLLRDHLALEWKAARNDSPAIEYYGSGPQSQKGNRSSFRREQTDLSFVAGVRPGRRHLTVGFESGFTLLNIGPGTRSGIPPADQIFGPRESPGINRQTDVARVGPVITFDMRDLPLDPHRGTFIQAKYLLYKGVDLDEFRFQKANGVVEHYLLFHNQKRVIALRGSTEWNLTDRRHVVPFYMQATLGGSDDLRGDIGGSASTTTTP